MSGWTAALLIADLVGVAVAVFLARRAHPAGSDARMLGYVTAGVPGVLVAVVALRATALGPFWTVAGIVVGVLAGFGVAPAWQAANDPGRRVLEQRRGTWPVAIPVLLVVFCVALVPSSCRPKQTPEQAYTERFEVKVDRLVTDVPVRVVARAPMVADAGVADAVAVPVERHAFAGRVLTLLVAHNLTCLPAVVLLAADDGLAVLVAVAPTAATPRTRIDPCLADPAYAFGGHSVVEVAFPDGLPTDPVRDTGSSPPRTVPGR
ncbi:hypothetical protein ACFFX1_53930 [Dactylosporangium sucinum]|uniref:Uncharacterized protein n=1 Tax=Dactylosporangium sucinum TaxID=1424081 RepID=A0A917U859_9ACTN|nr:hypothetical protein [Dactylosporangium sucinum]GGM61300.1 hypothetical protein GCM10007977_073490 [Dactylosporangium sucinum]